MFVHEVITPERSLSEIYPKCIEFESCTVGIIFPNNVCLTKEREVILVTDIERNDVNEFEPVIHGYSFLTVESAFKSNTFGDSKDINLYRVSLIELQRRKWTVQDISSKCYISPDFSHFNPNYKNPMPPEFQRFLEGDRRTGALFATIIAKRSGSKWLVQSLSQYL